MAQESQVMARLLFGLISALLLGVILRLGGLHLVIFILVFLVGEVLDAVAADEVQGTFSLEEDKCKKRVMPRILTQNDPAYLDNLDGGGGAGDEDVDVLLAVDAGLHRHDRQLHLKN